MLEFDKIKCSQIKTFKFWQKLGIELAINMCGFSCKFHIKEEKK